LPPSKVIYNKVISTWEERTNTQNTAQATNMRSKLRSTEENVTRPAVQADKGHTAWRLNAQSFEDVTVAQEDLNTWKTNPYLEDSETLGRKLTWTKSLPYWVLPQAVCILRRKVLQSPCKTGCSDPEIMRSTVWRGD
jgi:hypothetical protein